jgi:nucleotide-binding universal stress UspA family protein
MKRILVALDGSEHSNKAVDLAADLAEKYAAQLVLLHVISDKPLSDRELQMAEVEYPDEIASTIEAPSVLEWGGDTRLRAQQLLTHYSDLMHRFREAVGNRLTNSARARAQAKGARTVETMLGDGDPATTIVDRARDLEADMIIMGSRGLGGAKGLLMGSVSHKVAHLAECTCVTVK